MSRTTAITKGVLVSVEVQYKEQHSNPHLSRFVFFYNITIENFGNAPVQLLRRCWTIFEGSGIKRVIEGEGVVGEQPIIEANGRYQYGSWCPTQNTIGYMEGYYLMRDDEDGVFFEALIPRFQLIQPVRLN